jgi:NADPH2:quinone reductase
MRAAWYERQGPPEDVLQVGDMPDPTPGPSEVRIAVRASGINPGDVKKRSDAFGLGMPYPRVIPHSDGAGTLDAVGAEVSSHEIGDRVWCFGAQSYRAFGTAADYVVVPAELISLLSDNASFEAGACLGIPGITAHRAVHVSGSVNDRTVLVQGGAGAVGACAVSIARHSGAHVLATVRRADQIPVAEAAGAHHTVLTSGRGEKEAVDEILTLCPDGVDHIVEVAFHANVAMDEAVLRQGGSIATYATGDPLPTLPFWPLAFKNIALFFLGSDDFPMEAKQAAAQHLSQMLRAGWSGPVVSRVFSLDDIAAAHGAVESGQARGRVVLSF